MCPLEYFDKKIILFLFPILSASAVVDFASLHVHGLSDCSGAGLFKNNSVALKKKSTNKQKKFLLMMQDCCLTTAE